MPLKIVRNDITRMKCDAIVNTASPDVEVGCGCDMAIYKAAGHEELLEYRRKIIGPVSEGGVFLTPGFDLDAKYIIHAVSPVYIDGEHGEDKLLRKCYKDSLQLALDFDVKSIAFPLIATGSYEYPLEEGMRIAIDEINAFLLKHSMDVYLVVFDTKSTLLGEKLYPDLEAYIDHEYVYEKREEEYNDRYFRSIPKGSPEYNAYAMERQELEDRLERRRFPGSLKPLREEQADSQDEASFVISDSVYDDIDRADATPAVFSGVDDYDNDAFYEPKSKCAYYPSGLSERMLHMSDTFSEYLMYLINQYGLTNSEVYKRGIVDKRVFSKIKNNPDYHPDKMTAMCLCVGAQLSLDDTKDLLARAGYALSPCSKTDIIFTYFIENEIYDMIELDITLEEYGEPCLIK